MGPLRRRDEDRLGYAMGVRLTAVGKR
ncbi:MAG: hypothetical protein JWM19_4945, partial [Actinomycetia bacterium]|nr:hypothetical protein [Actinomycetes bacterium]